MGCTKTEIEEVSGNKPPGEKLVTQEMKDAYINRVYITLTGKKSTEEAFNQAQEYLSNHEGVAGRLKVVSKVMDTEDYTIQLYDVARADYLESVDTSLIRSDYIQVLDALQSATGPSREYYLEAERELKALLEIPDGLIEGTIDVPEMHRRLVDNFYYDDINMGTENFVVATFQNFLFRYPTSAELEQGKLIVDGKPGSLFLQAGNSKGDFLDIFFTTDDYFEGIVISLYRKYLFREPDTDEMYNQTEALLNGGTYQQLQQQILSSDEYFFN